MKKMLVVLSLVAMMPFSTMSAYASDNGNCRLVGLMSVNSVDQNGISSQDGYITNIKGEQVFSPAPKLKKGETDVPVTQYWKNKKTGSDFYCIHGGQCWPAHVKIGGKLVESVRVTNCKIKQKPVRHESYDNPDQDLYEFSESRRK